MGKFLLRFFILLLVTTVILIVYLSYFGLETDKFDILIKKKTDEISKYIKLDFKKTKIHLNPRELNLVIKLQKPKVLIRSSKINLSKLDLFFSLSSFFSSDFLLNRAEVAFLENDIKDLTKITNIIVPKIINRQLNKIFAKGKLEGEFTIPFKNDGSIGEDYGFSGKISDASINLTREFSIKNLTTEISYTKESKNDGFKAIIKKGSLYNLQLAESTINFKPEENKIKIKSLLHTKGTVSFSEVKKVSSLFDVNISSFKDISGKTDLKTKIDFDLSNKFKIKNLSYVIKGKIDLLKLDVVETKIIKQYLPLYNSKIILKETDIKFSKSKSNQTAELYGKIKIGEEFDSFKFKEENKYKNGFDMSGTINLTNSTVNIPRLNYKKDLGTKSELDFNINFILNKIYEIRSLIFFADKTKIDLTNLKLNNNFETVDFENLKIKTFTNQFKNNDYLIEKSKQISISGEIFDAEPLLKSLYKKNERKTFSKNFNSEIKINFGKILTGTDDNVTNLAMIASIKKGSYNKLSLKGNFSESEIVEMSIYQIDKDKKTLQVISDRARPFIKNFDFIKGFEGGKLQYESIISDKNSDSNLIITDFKVSKVPVLTKLLTLASLQGIADTLSGEGIRFDFFEMKSNSEGNVLNIEDALAMGPAISILLNGYVDKGKIVSLRGTLIPATKLNSIIASIPIVGDILVGKKTGEGVVGVSFKMKGPPKDIKTTVNPIKTLTPRFIVRAVEKMKNKKKEKSK